VDGLEAWFSRQKAEVEKERALKVIATLRWFAHGRPGAMFFAEETEVHEESASKLIATPRWSAPARPGAMVSTIEHGGQETGFNSACHSAEVCTWQAWGQAFTVENKGRERQKTQ
jgi:hypothetical protein